MKRFYFLLFFMAALDAHAQVGIGTNTPDASAKLDVASTNQGFLPPRVALTATNAAGPITNPATGLLVYNTATAGTAPNNVVPGYYYNSGSSSQPSWSHLSITDNTYKIASIQTTSSYSQQSLFSITPGTYTTITNSGISITVPSGYTSTQVVLQWNIWGDAISSGVAMGSLRLQLNQTGTSSNTVGSIMMIGWSIPGAAGGTTRYNAPIAYTITNLAPGTYNFNLSIEREAEAGNISAYNLWGVSGIGQVFVL